MTPGAESVVFLRAVNVGRRRVRMADLADLLRGGGFRVVGTHLASGNVVLSDREPDRSAIEAVIEAGCGFRSEAFVRTASEVTSLLERCPWPWEERLVEVSFVERTPEAAAARRLEASVVLPEELVVSGREVFFHREGKYVDAMHTEEATQEALGMVSTRRGMATIAGIVERFLR